MEETLTADSDVEDHDIERVGESCDVEVKENELNDNDVFCGRGAAINYRSGNRRFRALIRHFQPAYMKSTKKENKTKISRAIVEAVRNAKPPGRFLKKDQAKNAWYEIGDRKAWEKTSQTLRDLRDNSERKCKSEQKTRSVHPHHPERQTQHWYQEKDRQFQMMKRNQQHQVEQHHYCPQNKNNAPTCIPPLLHAPVPAMTAPVASLNAPAMPPLPVPPHVLFPQHQQIQGISETCQTQPNTPCFVNTFPPNPVVPFMGDDSTLQHINYPSPDPKQVIIFDPTTEKDGKEKDGNSQEVTTTNEQPSKTDVMLLHRAQQRPVERKEEVDYSDVSFHSSSKRERCGSICSKNDEKKRNRKDANENLSPERSSSKRPRTVCNDETYPLPTHTISGTMQNGETIGIPQREMCKKMEEATDYARGASGTFQARNDRVRENDVSLINMKNQTSLIKGSDSQVGAFQKQRRTQYFSVQEPLIGNKESFNIGSSGSQIDSKALKMKSTGTQKSDSGFQSRYDGFKITTNRETKRSSWPSTDWSMQDLAGQRHFQELQAALMAKQKESEMLNGTFLSENASLMQELSKWTCKPKHSTVETLQAHLYGYLFYPSEQRSPGMANLLDKICEENKLSPLKVIHSAASNILSESNIVGHNSAALEDSGNNSINDERSPSFSVNRKQG